MKVYFKFKVKKGPKFESAQIGIGFQFCKVEKKISGLMGIRLFLPEILPFHYKKIVHESIM